MESVNAAVETAMETTPSGSVASDPEVAISIQDLTIAYRSYKERPSTLKETLINVIKKGQLRYYSTFNALSDVTFQVKKGTVFGIIGSNGAGKSTLLRVIAGVLPPTKGKRVVEGSLGSLIQLGAGFDAELNAVENIYLNGSLQRRSRGQIAQRVNRILEFAELENFSTTPVKYYSSGMYARLGFSVAIDQDPDILVVDEILGVGDERFHTKCRTYFDNFIASGKTLVIVSHNMGFLSRMANEIAVLSRGKLIYVGAPDEAVARYQSAEYETALGDHDPTDR